MPAISVAAAAGMDLCESVRSPELRVVFGRKRIKENQLCVAWRVRKTGQQITVMQAPASAWTGPLAVMHQRVRSVVKGN